MTYGEKGLGWTDADPGTFGPAGTPAGMKRIILNSGDRFFGNMVWPAGLPSMGTLAWRNLLQQPADMMAPDGTGLERFLYYWTEQNYLPYAPPLSMIVPPLWYNDNEISTVANVRANINAYVEESIARFVTGQMNVDRDWDRFQTELRNLGIDQYLRIVQAAYDRSPIARNAVLF
jgi:putative aldouronate transport system substrate-binding protein